MEKLREFFRDNDVRIGEGKDFTSIPPVYYSSLNEAFHKYFLTFRDKKETLPFILQDEAWNRKTLAFTFTGSNENIVFSILGFHRFIELLLKDILRRVDPYLAVRFPERAEDVVEYMNHRPSAESLKTVEFSETEKRFKAAFKVHKGSEIYNKYLLDYEFLVNLENRNTLEILSDWRNRIMHNGSTLPNLFAFDYLVSQRLIPLIKDIINAEKKYLQGYHPHYFETATGIKIIDEILAVKFKFEDFKSTSKSKKLAMSLLKLGHLKELGRTAFNNTIRIGNNMSWYEPYYKDPKKRAERHAEAERQCQDFHDLRVCISCGLKSLVVYRQELTWPTGGFISWLKCYNCDYSLKDNVGDPHLFNLTEKPIFAVE